jgi:hypothetical protein
MSPVHQHIQKKMEHRKKTTPVFLLLVLVIFMAGSAGCIKLIQKTAGGESAATAIPDAVKAHGSPSIQSPSAGTSATRKSLPAPSIPVPTVTPQQPALVQEAAPILTPNDNVILHAVQINTTPGYYLLYKPWVFTKTYTLRDNATALLVNVTEGPLVIGFTVNPMYDCLADPDSCRGTALVSVNNPYLTITVRDNQTQEIVAEDGYAGEYSSNTTERYIMVYREGQFNITITGSGLDVTISITTGPSLNGSDLVGETNLVETHNRQGTQESIEQWMQSHGRNPSG